MSSTLRVVLAQIDLLVGDIEGNADKIIAQSRRARDQFKADLVVFPELSLTSYPPEDLLLRPALYQRVNAALQKLQDNLKDIDVIIGYPAQTPEGFYYNKASLIHKGAIAVSYCKQILPNYSVFDEKRYFKPGHRPCVTTIKGIPVAITICEDMWHHRPMLEAAQAGAKLMISINASPFDHCKPLAREQKMAQRVKEGNMPLIYVNLVGAQDELVFDGGSMVLNAQGEVCYSAGFYKEKLLPVDIVFDGVVHVPPNRVLPIPSEEERVYKALVLGVSDYIHKNNFPGALVGLSGGIDSALTLAIAVDAIGSNHVEAVLMPSRYTSEMSITDAKAVAEALGVKYRIISIETVFQAFLETLAPEFAGLPEDTTEENLQSRCRGTLLMAISNKLGSIVLATGNKSEMSVGYATLYGDMVGGFGVLKDVFKTWVYRLANYRNHISAVIPQQIIERAPSAELKANQTDQDMLPPYPILDAILERYIEQDQSPEDIIAAGFNKEIVLKITRMVDHNEYKRRQAPTGVRITQRAFGRDRRYPITSGFNRYLDYKE
ncbi:MAG: NAD+ synthase [Gammaproteobacteria bacterium]